MDKIDNKVQTAWKYGKNQKVKSVSRSVMSDSLRPFGLQPARLLCPWDSPGKNTGVGCHALLQGIFPTQGWYPRLFCLLPWHAGSLPLVPPGSPIEFLFIDVISLHLSTLFSAVCYFALTMLLDQILPISHVIVH